MSTRFVPRQQPYALANAGIFVPVVCQVPTALPHRLSVEQVEAAIRTGVLTENDRCELIRGELIDKMVISDQHMAVKRLNLWFCQQAAARYIVAVQDAIRLADSRPEPDIALLAPREDFYQGQTPKAADVLLLIEVADSSLTFDREVKGPLYAENGIREYWIVNLIERCVEVYREPQKDGRYLQVRHVTPDEAFSPSLLPDLSLLAGSILGI